MPNVLLTDWVGNTQSTTDFIDRAKAKQMAALLGIADMPLEVGDSLPLLWHWLFFSPHTLASDLGPDGHARKGGFLPPVDLPRRMWAGGRLKFHTPLVLGQKVERRSEIVSVVEKQGKSGSLAFVTVGHEFWVDDICALSEEHDIVYREMPTPISAVSDTDKPANTPDNLPGEIDWQHEIIPDPVLLFRYSAVTFNGHRIHYDKEYCQNEEGYPGLVFHGPLTATLMMKLFQGEHVSRNVAAFSFRAKNPLFDTAPFRIIGKNGEQDGDVWAITPDNKIAMEAKITFS